VGGVEFPMLDRKKNSENCVKGGEKTFGGETDANVEEGKEAPAGGERELSWRAKSGGKGRPEKHSEKGGQAGGERPYLSWGSKIKAVEQAGGKLKKGKVCQGNENLAIKEGLGEVVVWPGIARFGTSGEVWKSGGGKIIRPGAFGGGGKVALGGLFPRGEDSLKGGKDQTERGESRGKFRSFVKTIIKTTT